MVTTKSLNTLTNNLNNNIMTRTEKLVYSRALAETFSVEELQAMRKKALTSGIGGKVTSWSDIGLSSSMTYDFNVVTAVDILTCAIDMLSGRCVKKNEGIKKFVL